MNKTIIIIISVLIWVFSSYIVLEKNKKLEKAQIKSEIIMIIDIFCIFTYFLNLIN